ncbi:MAG TPA: hypothetical protein VD962_06320 [Rubricoccaceae bacterium]|nr:hypothetical protein [Rubricoccaceae bacterium]
MTTLLPLRLSLIALCLLALFGMACGGGGGDDSPAQDDQSAAEESTGEEAANEATNELFDTQFAQVCRGTGQPRAAAYTPGAGVHPILVMRSDDGTEYTGSFATLPEGWGAQWPDLERTELVACERRVSAEPGEVCEGYSDEDSGTEWSVQIHDVVYEYVVRVARTGEELGRQTFEVPAGSCPMITTYTEGDPVPQPYYPSVGAGEVELFVRPFVTGS